MTYPHLAPPRVPPGRAAGRFACVKAYGRLFVLDLEASRQADGIPHPGCLIYTPPDWLRLTGREKMVTLAGRASAAGGLTGKDMAAFEASCARRPGYGVCSRNPGNRDLPFPEIPPWMSTPTGRFHE